MVNKVQERKYSFLFHICTGLLTGMLRRCQDTWSGSSPSRYLKGWKSSNPGGDKTSDGSAVWGQRDTRGTSSGGQVDKREELWRLQKILSNKMGSLSQTNMKNTEANVQVHDLNQKTMQALGSLAAAYAVFEKAGGKLNVGNSECDVILEESRAATDEFQQAQRVQERAREELYVAHEAHAMAFMDLQERVAKMSDCQEVVDEKCRFLNDSDAKFNETKESPKVLKIRSGLTGNDEPPRIGGVRDHRRRPDREPWVYGPAHA